MSEKSILTLSCANGSQAAFEDIMSQDKRALLSVLQQATGLGKTYGAVRAMVNKAVFRQRN